VNLQKWRTPSVSINEAHNQSDVAPTQEIGVSATGGSASGISTSNIGVIVNDISYSGIGITVPAGDTRASHVGAPTGESSEMENPLNMEEYPLIRRIPQRMALNVFINADHAQDKISGQSIIGPFTTLGSTTFAPWESK
jgi:hypothetical protein